MNWLQTVVDFAQRWVIDIGIPYGDEVIPLMVILLLGTGFYLTVRTGFVQLSRLGHGFGVTSGKYDDPDDPGDVSHFQALTTALSERHLEGAELAFAAGQPLGEHPKAAFVLDSYRFAHRFAQWTEALWNELLAAAPLDREAARALIGARLSADPLPPLRVLD